MKIRHSIRRILLVLVLGLVLALTASAPVSAQTRQPSTREQNEKIIRYIAIGVIVWFIIGSGKKK